MVDGEIACLTAGNLPIDHNYPKEMNLVIHYNVERGFEDLALALARRLFARFDTAIDSLALVPVADEDLDLWFNGQLMGSMSQTGRAPLVADVVSQLQRT